MRKKRWNRQERIWEEEYTDNLIITTEGKELRNKLGIYNDLIFLKIRPYVEPVKQCYNCFRFGHLKANCRSSTCCINCADIAHGQCSKEESCRNCKEKHRSTNKKCLVLEYNKTIKVTIAYNNCTYHKAIRIIEGRENTPRQEYDRYSQPQSWPSLQRNKLYTETTSGLTQKHRK